MSMNDRKNSIFYFVGWQLTCWTCNLYSQHRCFKSRLNIFIDYLQIFVDFCSRLVSKQDLNEKPYLLKQTKVKSNKTYHLIPCIIFYQFFMLILHFAIFMSNIILYIRPQSLHNSIRWHIFLVPNQTNLLFE
jgi:hypothetical protein